MYTKNKFIVRSVKAVKSYSIYLQERGTIFWLLSSNPSGRGLKCRKQCHISQRSISPLQLEHYFAMTSKRPLFFSVGWIECKVKATASLSRSCLSSISKYAFFLLESDMNHHLVSRSYGFAYFRMAQKSLKRSGVIFFHESLLGR